jgi:hypothetical protein
MCLGGVQQAGADGFLGRRARDHGARHLFSATGHRVVHDEQGLHVGRPNKKGIRPEPDPLVDGGRYWDRTSGFHRVKVALYR